MVDPAAAAYAARSWTHILAPYRDPNSARSVVEIIITFSPLAALWALASTAICTGYWEFSPLLTVLAAGFLVRLFMIQHDCGHGSFFRHRLANDWVGRVIGVLTFTPYDFWRRAHAIHHASSGHLERRGIGDVDTLTVREYLSRSFWGRLRYRAYRHPLVMFGVGPAYLFILQHRLPIGLLRGGWQPWVSTMATNVAIAAITAGLIWLIGLGPFLLVQLPISLLAGSIGVWLFYVHHVHHLCSRIPYYRLQQVLQDHPELLAGSRLTLLESFRCVRLVLWDEGLRRLISFRELVRLPVPSRTKTLRERHWRM